MNKDEYTELFDKNGVEAWEQAEKLPADEVVSLMNGFEQVPDEEKTQSAKLAYEVLKNSMMTRINDMRGKLDSLSLAELDALEVLIGKAESLGGMSDIDGLKASIKDHRAALESSDAQNVDDLQPQQTNTDVKADDAPTSGDDEIFDEQALAEKYGIDDESLQEPQIVERNLDALEGMPSNDELLKDESLKDVKQILDRLDIVGKDGNIVAQDGPDSDIALLLEQVRNETEMYLANTSSEPITQEAFKREYAARLSVSLVEMMEIEAVDHDPKDLTEDEIKKYLSDRLESLSGDQRLSLKQETLGGWQNANHIGMQKAHAKLAQKDGYQNVAGRFGDRLKSFDEKLQKKYPDLYKLGKTVLTAGAWSAAYSAGAALGPAGLGLVAGIKLADSTVKLINDYKQKKAEAEAKNEEYRFFKDYCPQNKAKIIGMGLTAVGGVFGVTGTGAETMIGNMSFNTARMGAGLGLAAVTTTQGIKEAWKNTEGPWYKKTWASAKVLGTSVAGFVAGSAVGQAIGGWWHHDAGADAATDTQRMQTLDGKQPAYASNPNEEVHVPYTKEGWEAAQAAAAEQNVAPEGAPIPYTQEGWEAVQAAEALHDQVTNLSTQQQHDIQMLFARDAREANEILGGKWMSSDALQKAWENGTITDAQKAELLDFASQRFDAAGNFQDVEGYQSATSMEQEARDWTAKMAAQKEAETPQTTEAPNNDSESFETTEQTLQQQGDTPRGRIYSHGVELTQEQYKQWVEAEKKFHEEWMERFPGIPDEAEAAIRAEVFAEHKAQIDSMFEGFRNENQNAEHIQSINDAESQTPGIKSDVNNNDAQQHDEAAKTVKWNGIDVTKEQAEQLRAEEQRYTEYRKSQNLWDETPQERDAAHQEHLQNLKNIIDGPQKDAESQTPGSASDANDNVHSSENETRTSDETPVLQEVDMHTTANGLKYSIDENGGYRTSGGELKIDWSFDKDELAPDIEGDRIVSSEDTTIHYDESTGEIEGGRILISDDIVRQEIMYQDLMAREQAGDTLTAGEQKFIAKHEQLLEDRDLIRDEHGTIRYRTLIEKIDEPKIKVGHDNIRVQGTDSDGHKIDATIDEQGRYLKLKVNGVKQEYINRPAIEGLYEHFKEEAVSQDNNHAQNIEPESKGALLARLRGINHSKSSASSTSTPSTNSHTASSFGKTPGGYDRG